MRQCEVIRLKDRIIVRESDAVEISFQTEEELRDYIEKNDLLIACEHIMKDVSWMEWDISTLNCNIVDLFTV